MNLWYDAPTGIVSTHGTVSYEVNVSKRPLVLASASPRRHELLAQLGVPFDVVATNAEQHHREVPPHVADALTSCPWLLAHSQHPTLLAWRKAITAWEQHRTAVVLGADTVVVVGQRILNKPRNAADAHDMLALLAGRTHTVSTGLFVCVAPAADTPDTPHVMLELITTRVTFAPLEPEQIAAYVASGEPLDKAGAYGIQGAGGQFVTQVEGSLTSVVGLPLPATQRMLTAAGIAGLHDATAAYHRWLQAAGKEPLPCPPTLP